MYTFFVKNVTISLDEILLEKARERARRQGKSFNELVRELLARESNGDPLESLARFFEVADQLGGRSEDGKPLSREEAHERGH